MTTDYFDDPPEDKTTDFFEGGSPSCKFNNIGDVHTGEIIDFEVAQQRDIKTGQPKSWPDGNPCQMLVITLQTAERDPDIDDDDGTRKLYVNKPGGMFAAIMAAKGKNRFSVGGTLAIKYTGNGKPKAAGFSPPKEYAAKYVPPSGEASALQQQQRHHATSAPVRAPLSPTAPLNGDVQAMRREAFKAFCEARPGKDIESITPEWRDLLKSIGNGKASNDFSVGDWHRTKIRAVPVENPISDEPEFTEAEIPF